MWGGPLSFVICFLTDQKLSTLLQYLNLNIIKVCTLLGTKMMLSELESSLLCEFIYICILLEGWARFSLPFVFAG